MKAQKYKHFFKFLEKLPFEIGYNEWKTLEYLHNAGIRFNPNAKTMEDFTTPLVSDQNGKPVLYNLHVLEGELKELKEIWKNY